MLRAQIKRAFEKGIPATRNNGAPNADGYPTHRCPVGDRVNELTDVKFDSSRPLPWAGELYAESDDGRTMYRLYFIERRADWHQPTDRIIGCGIGSKPVDESTAWSNADQTRDIHVAMD